MIFTVFDLADVADDDVFDEYLHDFAVAYDANLLFALDSRLEAAELALLAPVIERCDQHDQEHGGYDRRAFDPARLRLSAVAMSCTSQTTHLGIFAIFYSAQLCLMPRLHVKWKIISKIFQLSSTTV